MKKMSIDELSAVQTLLNPINYDAISIPDANHLNMQIKEGRFSIHSVNFFILPWYESYNCKEKKSAKEGLFHFLTSKKVDYDRIFGQLDLAFDWRENPRGFLETLWVGLYNEPIPER